MDFFPRSGDQFRAKTKVSAQRARWHIIWQTYVKLKWSRHAAEEDCASQLPHMHIHLAACSLLHVPCYPTLHMVHTPFQPISGRGERHSSWPCVFYIMITSCYLALHCFALHGVTLPCICMLATIMFVVVIIIIIM